MTPYDITPGSKKQVWWQCAYGHEWKTNPGSRVRGRNCPDCNPQTSRLEIRVYCELKTVFNNVRWRERIDGIECDIYLPDYQIDLEIDGYPWHDGFEKRDLQKDTQLAEKGIQVIRLRNDRLKPLSQTDIIYKKTDRRFDIVARVLHQLLNHELLISDDKIKLTNYLNARSLQNNRDARAYVKPNR